MEAGGDSTQTFQARERDANAVLPGLDDDVSVIVEDVHDSSDHSGVRVRGAGGRRWAYPHPIADIDMWLSTGTPIRRNRRFVRWLRLFVELGRPWKIPQCAFQPCTEWRRRPWDHDLHILGLSLSLNSANGEATTVVGNGVGGLVEPANATNAQDGAATGTSDSALTRNRGGATRAVKAELSLDGDCRWQCRLPGKAPAEH